MWKINQILREVGYGGGFGYVGGAGGGGGGNSAACRVLQSPAGVCSPLLYEANEQIPGYLDSRRA